MSSETEQATLGAYGADPPSRVIERLRQNAEQELRENGLPRVEVPEDA